MTLGNEGGRIRCAQGDGAPAEASPGHAGAVDAGQLDQPVDQLVERGDRNPEVLGQAAVSVGHHCPDCCQIAPAQEPLHLAHPGTLGDDVAGPAAQHRFGQHAQIAELAEPQGAADEVGRPFALGPALGVARRTQLAGGTAVHDDERRPVGDGDLMGLEVGEVDGQGVPGLGAENGQGVEQPDR